MIKQAIFKIKGMHCASCAVLLDLDLEEVVGVKKSSTSYAKAETIVEYDEDKVDKVKIIEVVKKTGYSATSD
jgi:copper chaperone CopZ